MGSGETVVEAAIEEATAEAADEAVEEAAEEAGAAQLQARWAAKLRAKRDERVTKAAGLKSWDGKKTRRERRRNVEMTKRHRHRTTII